MTAWRRSTRPEGEDVAGVEPGFAAVTERAGNQEFHHDMVLAERIPNGLVIDVGERLKRLYDRRADGRLPGVEGAMRLSASRNLPDAIVGHQHQRAVDIVSVPRLQKAIHKYVVVARHFGSSRSPASRQRGTAPGPTNSATARVTASGCSNSRKCPARGRSITRTRSPNCSRSAWPLPGGATSSSSPWITRRGAVPAPHQSSSAIPRLVARWARCTAGQHSTCASIFGSDAGDSQRAPRTVTQSLPFILTSVALRKDVPSGVAGPMRPPAASKVTLRTNEGRSTARQRATRLPKA